MQFLKDKEELRDDILGSETIERFMLDEFTCPLLTDITWGSLAKTFSGVEKEWT